MTPVARLSQAYHTHHFKCAHCIAAGQTRQARCTLGQRLWLAYQQQADT